MLRLISLTGLGLGALLAAAPLPAEPGPRLCGPHDAIASDLAQRFGESRRAAALSADNTVIEFFANDATGSWSLTVTTPGGPTCLVAAGEAFVTFAPDPAAGDPAA